MFWKVYPRHEVKANARRAFERINPDDETIKNMLQWIEQAKYSIQWSNPLYIPHPATWLNRRQWEDDLPPMKTRDTIGQPTTEESWLTDEQRAEAFKRMFPHGLV